MPTKKSMTSRRMTIGLINRSTVCLPKARIGKTEEGEDIYDAESARPLEIVSADNRLMANAVRARYEAIVER